MQVNHSGKIVRRTILGLGIGLFAAPGLAVDTLWTAGDSDWSTSGNWSIGEPTAANRAVINNGGTAHVGTGEQTNGVLMGNLAGNSGTLKIEDAADTLESLGATSVTIGNAGSGTVIQSAGSFTLGNSTTVVQTLTLGGSPVGSTTTGTGFYQLSGGTLTTYGTVNIGTSTASIGVGTFTQSAGIHNVSANTVANTGRMFISNGTYDLTGGNLNVTGSTLNIGNGGTWTARLTLNGPTANASISSSLTVGSTSQGLMELKQGTVNVTGSFLVGNATGSIGTVTQTGGSLTSSSVNSPLLLGSAAGSTGTYNLLGGTLSIGSGASRDLAVGNSGTGTFNIGNATGRGTLTQISGSADVIVRVTAGAAGTFRGWSDDGVTNNISLAGSFTNNGVVIADGYNTDRSLRLTSFAAANPILNSIDNGPTETNGWFARDNGKLVLKAVTVPANNSVNWGEASGDTTIDLINSVRLTTTTGVTAGTLDIALLATDRTDAATAVAAASPNQLISLFQLTPGTFGFNTGSATFTTRYDHTGLVGDESQLKLLLYSGGIWADVTGSVDATNRRITSNSLSSFGGGYLAVAVVPEPATLTISAGALGLFLRRHRRRRSLS